jgi:hypothetical protein
MKITIAGITHFYRIDCTVVTCSGNYFLMGAQRIKLTDFDIEPPEKFFGLVKVSDEINVSYRFIVTFTTNNQISELL